MRVLILGASGFLGRHVWALLGRDARFEVVAGPRSRDLDLGHAGHRAWNMMLYDAAPEAVVNCAGRTHGTFEELLQANVSLVDHLIWSAQTRPRPPRIVHLGSAAEYGPAAEEVSETSPTAPAGPYGESKLAGTQALLDARPRLNTTVLRVFNPVGPGQGPHTLPGAAARQFQRAQHEGRSRVDFGDLGAARDFIDARDVARAVKTVLLTPPAEGLLNVGRGEPVLARTLVHELARIACFCGSIAEQDEGSVRSAGLSRQQADVSRLRALGWTPMYSIEQSLDALWRDISTPVPLRQPSL